MTQNVEGFFAELRRVIEIKAEEIKFGEIAVEIKIHQGLAINAEIVRDRTKISLGKMGDGK